jgi:arsenate reductase (glutaredoxin)
MYKVYGIPNCNTVKKALTQLDKKQIPYEFINFKKTAPSTKDIKNWKEAFGDWPVNAKGPTYRKIKDEFEEATANAKIQLLIQNSSALKRPILCKNDQVLCFGYEERFYNELKN